MKEITYQREKTALLFIDPYNDFLSEGGKIWPRVKVEMALMSSLLPFGNLYVLAAKRHFLLITVTTT
jgi:nicotinamidase-related amidase